jgi:DNA polymerase-3 subunit alpha
MLGEKACFAIMAERDKGLFCPYEDFCNRLKRKTVNNRIRQNLVKAGAFDSLHSRPELIKMLLTILKRIYWLWREKR